jgi:hypothetical protein
VSVLALVASALLLATPRVLVYFGLIGPSARDRIAEAERMVRAAESYGATSEGAALAAARQELETARRQVAAGNGRAAREAAGRAVAKATDAQAAALVREREAEQRAQAVVEELDHQVNELENMFDEVSRDLSRERRSALLKMMREARKSAASVFLAHDEKRYKDALAHEQQARKALAETRGALQEAGARPRRDAASPAGSPGPVGRAEPAPSTLPVPYESAGACPFECCTYRTWTVRRATDVRASRRAGAPAAFRVSAGEKVEALTGVVVVDKPGRGRAPHDVTLEGLPLRSGDEVVVLHPVGEGYWRVWRDGRTANAQVGDPQPASSRWQPDVQMAEKPRYTWWVQLRDARGRTGWVDQPDNFGDKDRCA